MGEGWGGCEMLRDAARCCKGLQGAWGVAEGYRALREAVGCRGGTPMVPMVTDLTDFCFSSQLLLIHTNNELKKGEKCTQFSARYDGIFCKKMAENILGFSIKTPIDHLRKIFDNIEEGICFLSIILALNGLQSRHSLEKHYFWTTGIYYRQF
jgi:hypothetical protein